MIDLHAHILPNVDDGSKSLEESIEMLKIAVSNGVKHQLMTPHVQSTVSKVDPKAFLDVFNTLKKEVKLQGLPIEIYLGAEVNYRSHLSPDYSTNTLNQSKYLLIEFSISIETPIEDIVYDLSREGFIPIIAHVERYKYLTLSDYPRLKQAGALFQINADAVVGKKDKHQKKLCAYLIKEGLVDFVATDCHSKDKRPPNLKEAYDFLKKTIDSKYLEDLFYNNARPIIAK